MDFDFIPIRNKNTRKYGEFSGYIMVDSDDYLRFFEMKWSLNSNGYARTYINGKWITMHKLIMDTPPGKEVDHINCNKLDNRKINLRIVTKSQNNMNRKPYKNSSSKFKGVFWDKNLKKWRAYITLNKKRKWLGSFNSEEEAAIVYDSEATKLFGKYAKTNSKLNLI